MKALINTCRAKAKSRLFIFGLVMALASPAAATVLPPATTGGGDLLSLSQTSWLPRADFLGGPCIMEADLGFGTAAPDLPRTCIPRPCENLLTIEELQASVYRREIDGEELQHYDTAWVRHCIIHAVDETWGGIRFYALDGSGLGAIADMVTPHTDDGETRWPDMAGVGGNIGGLQDWYRSWGFSAPALGVAPGPRSGGGSHAGSVANAPSDLPPLPGTPELQPLPQQPDGLEDPGPAQPDAPADLTPVPLPPAGALLGGVAAAFGWFGWRRRSRHA